MNAADIVDCSCDLLKHDLTLNSTSSISQTECEVAQHLCGTIIRLNGCKGVERKRAIKSWFKRLFFRIYERSCC